MFQSYEFQKYLGYDDATKEYRWQYKITDSDFEEVVVSENSWVAVIEVYEKRNLPVAPNLIAAILYLNKQHPYVSIQEFIEYNRKYNPKFAQYEEDLSKYLSLL